MSQQRVVVIGAGVVGLTSAIRLAEAGYDVAVVARDLSAETTSAMAGALWYPYLAEPRHEVLAWSASAFAAYAAELSDSDSGVHLVDGLELRQSESEPWFVDALPEIGAFAHFTDLPESYADGWQMRLPVIEPSIYLPRLTARLVALGGTITRMAVTALPDDALVVNCSGLAARSLATDPEVTPTRGQVVRLERTLGVDAWLLDHTEPSSPVYVIPRSRDVMVGGTVEAGSYDLHPDQDCAVALVERASRFVPALSTARVLGTYVGLRPTRPTVRLERELRPEGGHVIHNYGHGGAGWTIAWGCAEQVVREVRSAVTP